MRLDFALLGLLALLLARPVPAQNDASNQLTPAAPSSGADTQSPTNQQVSDKWASDNGGAYRVGGGVSPPRVIHDPDPYYSEKARRAYHQGTVVLWLIVGTDGKPHGIRVQRSLGMGLDEEAVKAVEKWRFQPATKDGHPVPVMINVEVNFRLYDSLSPYPESAGEPPRFPGVDLSKYPLILKVGPVNFAGSGPDGTADLKAVMTEAGRQSELTISCVVASPHCLVAAEGTYPARWEENGKTLELLGLTDKRKWKPAQYTVAAQ